MKTSRRSGFVQAYKKYLWYGAASILTVWLMALLTVIVLPGPFRFDFFGVIAESTVEGYSVRLSWKAFVSAFITLPLILILIDYFKDRSDS